MLHVRAIIKNNVINIASEDLFLLGCAMENYSFGELTIMFFDMKIEELINTINFPIIDSVDNYLNECYHKLYDKVGVIFSVLIINDIEKIIVDSENQADQKSYINEELNAYFQCLEITQVALSACIDSGICQLDRKISGILSSIQNISTCFLLDEETKQIDLVFEINNFTSIIALDFCYIINKNINIKQCKNCHKYFIPSKRSDEIYCNRIFRNGKSCKEIGPEEKIKNDEFSSAYRKAYKTQHQRIKYNKHNKQYKEKHFEPWRDAAKKAMTKFRSSNDIAGFIKWLDDNVNSF